MTKFLTLCVLPMVILLVAASILLFTGHPTAAWGVGMLGTAVWWLIVLAYIVLVDSKGRWPQIGGWKRLQRVLTFTH